MTTLTSDGRQMTTIMKFLLEKLQEYHTARNNYPATLDENMCRYSSLFVAKCLGKGWHVAGGEDWEDFYTRELSMGGVVLKDGRRKGHYWATNGGVIVDFAAAQFGFEAIRITHGNSPDYIPNYTKVELRGHLKYVRSTVNKWYLEYRDSLLEK